MTIEKSIDALTLAINNLAAAYTQRSASLPIPIAAIPVGNPGTPAPVAAPMPAFTMPTAPVAPVAPAIPFNDAKTLLAYVMDAYKAMGATKGAGIQQVLTNLGVGNINEVTPDKYAALFAGIEQLKAS